ncbi:hypothetical protein ACN9M1_00430 [Ralstonia sp. R-29]|uniref:hypothetical protein n=1 Tax=Ralstonia sp. R-29 TaxID=3404059 RepID=UPI003CEC98D4
MKSFRFENIWLLSHQAKKAKHINFHPKKNLVVGRNHTGKTSLIRTLFETLGAKPHGKLEFWDDSTVSVLEFVVDEKHFYAAHQSGRRALFNSNRELIVATSNFQEWSRAFCDVTEFNLVFLDKTESVITPADPACFFVPFYINQDGSWQSEWGTFDALKRLRAPYGAILEYFTGVCPPDYYTARAERGKETMVLEEHRRELKLLERAMDKFNQALPLFGPKISPWAFEAEIKVLTREVGELNAKQEELRDAAVREQELLASIEQQVKLADDALAGHDHDASYLRREGTPSLVCPTCHAEHTKSFLDLLEFSEDARVLRELCGRLRDDADIVRRRYLDLQYKIKNLDEDYQKIASLLNTRKGDLKLQDVVRSMGAENALAVFEGERSELLEQIKQALARVDAFDRKMKTLRTSKKTREILEEFRTHYTANRVALQLPVIDASKMKLTSRPDLSGSGGPRSILAYYSALWRTCQGVAGTYSVPIVIDSPNQQAQDDINLPAVLKFIAEKLPTGMQLIVGLENPTEFAFDRVFQLTTKYSLLGEEDWDRVREVVEPMLKDMYDQLLFAKLSESDDEQV